MIYSYDERKIGSYFGEDLYEKCIAVDDTTDSAGQIFIDITGGDKVVSATLHNYDSETGAHTESNIGEKVQTTNIQGINLILYDYLSVEEPAQIAVETKTSDKLISGFVKVQYTKLATD